MLSLIKFQQVFTIHQVPRAFHEDGIISGYRHPRSSATDCVWSLFQLTNETLNVWTHFLPTCEQHRCVHSLYNARLFGWLLIFTVRTVQHRNTPRCCSRTWRSSAVVLDPAASVMCSNNSNIIWYFLWKLMTVLLMEDVWHDAYTWPLLVFLACCCVYPLASSCAHTFNTMSSRARHICYFFDYGALSLYSLGSAVSYSAYVFPDAWLGGSFHSCYIPVAVLNTILSTSLACYSRLGFPFLHYNHDFEESSCPDKHALLPRPVPPPLFSGDDDDDDDDAAIVVKNTCLSVRFSESRRPRLSKVLRILAFAWPYLFDNIPLFYRLLVCVGEGCTENEANSLHVQHTLLAFLTAFLFATHLPERLAPGRFDYIGHSHQLFHVCAIIATHFQMKAIEVDMNLRQMQLLDRAPAVSFHNTMGAALLSAGFSLAIICIFSVSLLGSLPVKTPEEQNLKQTSTKCS
ncbi:hypothetical protein DNTS_010271 [Danionella cerebrum]|uniref:Progestin and adipoQ receptor family member 5 n=1 Tax=Danionella cerebrum TaxID=2873325 RepID=A0A553MR89_9TELE|nr:hypothetical protein DNTS_010271 [Danionella translucida]